jgi:hypothetical protein
MLETDYISPLVDASGTSQESHLLVFVVDTARAVPASSWQPTSQDITAKMLRNGAECGPTLR